jgi:hypothetical protein
VSEESAIVVVLIEAWLFGVAFMLGWLMSDTRRAE